MTGAGVSFTHLRRLSDSTGLFEHAELTERRLEHGYCVDDVARGLVVTTREPEPDEATTALAATYQRFLASAQGADGGFRNRLDVDLTWQDEPSVADCWGRALWGLGTAAARSPQLAARGLGTVRGQRGETVALDASDGLRRRWARPRSSRCTRTTRWPEACSPTRPT